MTESTKDMNPVIEIFMERDGMDKAEAVDCLKRLRADVLNTLETYKDNYGYVEDLLYMHSLEMDYITDII